MAITMLIGEPEELAKFSLEFQKQARSQVQRTNVDKILHGFISSLDKATEWEKKKNE